MRSQTYLTNYVRANPTSDSIKIPAISSIREELLILHVHGGRANPVGEFADRDLSSQTAGLAKNGFCFGASATLKFNKYIGVKAQYLFQQNDLDENLIEAGLGNPGSGNAFLVDAGSWIVRGFFGGFHFTSHIKTNNNLLIDVDLMAGLPKCVLPPLKIRLQYGNTVMEVIEQTASPTSAFALMPSLGLHYNFKNPLTANFNLSYLTTEVTFGDVKTTLNGGGSILEKRTQRISTINAQLGLSWRIN